MQMGGLKQERKIEFVKFFYLAVTPVQNIAVSNDYFKKVFGDSTEGILPIKEILSNNAAFSGDLEHV